MPSISVIIPVYNVEPYLERCVKSVLNQTNKDYEIILVDDGSPDNCPGMCDNFAKEYDFVKVIHKENGGLSSARNAGLKVAEGEYVTFLDSDDFFHPQTLEIILNKLEEIPADICVFEYKVVEEDVNDFPDINDVKMSQYSGKEAIKQMLTWKKSWEFVTSCVKVYKTKIFDNIQFPVGKLHEDNFTTWKCYLASEVVIKCYAPLYYIFRNPTGITRSPYSLRRLDAVEAIEEMMETLKTVDNELWRLSVEDYIHACQYACIMVKKELNNKEVYNQLRKKMHNVIKKYGLQKPFNMENYLEAYMIIRPLRAELYFKKMELKRRINKLRGYK